MTDPTETPFEQAVSDLDNAAAELEHPDAPDVAALLTAARALEEAARDYVATAAIEHQAANTTPAAMAAIEHQAANYTPATLTTPAGEQPAGDHPDTFAI